MERRPIIAGREVAVKGEMRVESQLFSFAQNGNPNHPRLPNADPRQMAIGLRATCRSTDFAIRANRLTLAARL
jgi:hypothetical protein